MTRGSSRNVWALGLTSLLNDAAGEMVVPFLPLFLVGTLGAGGTALGLIEGAADTTASLLKALAGRWSDRVGVARPFVWVGYLLAAASRPLLAFAGTPGHVLAVRVTDRIGKGLRTAPRDALIAGSVPDDERGAAFGLHRSMDHTGAVIGPLLALGALTFVDDLRQLFALTAVPGLLAVAATLAVREVPPPTTPAQAADRPAEQAYPWRWLLPVALATLGTVSDAFLMLKLGVEEEAPLVALPLAWMALSTVRALVTAPAGRIADAWGPLPVVVTGWTLRAGCLGLLALSGSTLGAGLAVVAIGVSALSEPGEKAIVSRLVGPRRQGTAFGGYHGTVGLMALPAGVGFGLLWDQVGSTAAFGVAAGLSAAAAGFVALTLRGRV